jgi:uncharacterized protein YdhG (YjbR/CyaY superfamily)
MAATPRKRARTRPSRPPKTVEEYIARAPELARRKLKEFRAILRSAVPPDASEVISYGIPAFGQKKILVWYAVFSNHCSLFPTASVIAMFKDELKSYSKSKGTIHFPIDDPLPADLIRKIVRTRVGHGS